MVPLAGGDPIPLVKDKIVIGRRPDCDIQLEHANVSSRHCELRFTRGTWIVKDLGSTNGVRVNGSKVEKKRLTPGDELTIARKHHFRVDFDGSGYVPTEKSIAEAEIEAGDEDIFKQSLLQRAGLERPSKPIQFDSDLFTEEESLDEKDRKRIDLD